MTVDELTTEELTQIIRGLQMLVDSRYYTVDEIIADTGLIEYDANYVHLAINQLIEIEA